MTDREMTILKQMIANEMTFYGAQFSEMKVKMFAEEMRDLPLESIHRAYFTMKKDPARKNQMPMPSEVRQFISPQMTEENKAITAAELLISSVKKFGWPEPEKAKEYMGEIAWRLVQENGGWSWICSNMGTHTLPTTTFKAQLRVSAKALIERAKLGQLDTPPSLPSPDTKSLSEQKRVSALINGATKGIPK